MSNTTYGPTMTEVILRELDRRAGLEPLLTNDIAALGDWAVPNIITRFNVLMQRGQAWSYRHRNMCCWFRSEREAVAFGLDKCNVLVAQLLVERGARLNGSRWGASSVTPMKPSKPAGVSVNFNWRAPDGEVTLSPNVKITRDTTPRPTARWQLLPDSNTPLFSAVGIGRDIQTGRAWA